MQKKDLLGGYLDKRFAFHASMKKLDGDYKGHSALYVFLDGTRVLTIKDDEQTEALTGAGYLWLTYQPTGESWALMAFIGPTGRVLRWYFDISRPAYIDEDGMPCRDDLYLDLVILPDGRPLTKDEDELKDALASGKITREDYGHACRVRDALLASQWCEVPFLANLTGALLGDYGPDLSFLSIPLMLPGM